MKKNLSRLALLGGTFTLVVVGAESLKRFMETQSTYGNAVVVILLGLAYIILLAAGGKKTSTTTSKK